MNKILHLTFGLKVGGAEHLLVDMANLQAHHARVSIVIVNDEYDETLAGRISKDIEVVFIGRKEGSWSLKSVLRLWKWLRTYQPDRIHCHQHKLIGLLPFWRHKTVVTVHDVGVPTTNLKKYKKVFSISAAVQQDLLQRGRIPSSVVHNGILLEKISRKEPGTYGSEGIYKLVQVSRLYHEKKGQHIAIKALKVLHENGFPNIYFYMIGEGPSFFYLKSLVRELHLEKSVFFLGPRERSWVYTHLSDFDLLVQPSLYEGFGLAILEGIAAGLPVVASRVDGPAEILSDTPGAFLFNSGDEKDLANAVKEVMALTRQNKIEELCSVSYKMVEQSYSIHQTATNYLKSYTAVDSNHPTKTRSVATRPPDHTPVYDS